MKTINFYKLLFAALVITFASSSCKTYNETMTHTHNHPITQKLPNLEIAYKANCIVPEEVTDIVGKTINNELSKNVISDEGDLMGKIEIVYESYELKKSALDYFWTVFSATTAGGLNVFYAMPFSGREIDMKFIFNILDVNNNVIKTYSYQETDKAVSALYYGKPRQIQFVDMSKRILIRLRKDIEADSRLITAELKSPNQKEPGYIQKPIQQNEEPFIAVAKPVKTTTTKTIQSDVDTNIPKTGKKASDTFVLIIANENYTFVDNVDFAIHDGEIFKEYCINTLGVPERQVWFYKDASGGIISGGVGKMVQAMSLFENSKAIVYYCGHGIPDEHTGDAYIVPTDGNGKNIATCYSLNKLYTTLASSNATSVTYFMDACFSGANKEGSMLVAARGVAREAKKEKLNGNTVVFSAASGDETAMTYKEKGHGLFTYFLLKKLQETKGDVSYGDLDKYIKDNVKRESFLTNEKVQTPTTNVSENAINNWKTMKLK